MPTNSAYELNPEPKPKTRKPANPKATPARAPKTSKPTTAQTAKPKAAKQPKRVRLTAIVREHLRMEGDLLAERGSDHYYYVRDRFNDNPTSLDFLFLNRSCFNGVMRFNSKGRFNVPFCKKPERFRQAYVTKIANQVSHLESVMQECDWHFETADWRECLAQATEDDFVYADPPYAGRHTDYFSTWNEQQEVQLLCELRQLPCGFALST